MGTHWLDQLVKALTFWFNPCNVSQDSWSVLLAIRTPGKYCSPLDCRGYTIFTVFVTALTSVFRSTDILNKFDTKGMNSHGLCTWQVSVPSEVSRLWNLSQSCQSFDLPASHQVMSIESLTGFKITNLYTASNFDRVLPFSYWSNLKKVWNHNDQHTRQVFFPFELSTCYIIVIIYISYYNIYMQHIRTSVCLSSNLWEFESLWTHNPLRT